MSAGAPGRRILLTGAAGLVGGVLRAHLRPHYHLVMLDRAMIEPVLPGEEFIHCDIRNAPVLAAAMTGVDAVVHLAGAPTETDWDTIRDANIEGCYRVVEAARVAGVRRFVFASSNHAIGQYPRDEPVDHTSMPRPDTRYGVSKAFGESLLSYYADKFGLTAVCLRIGTLRTPDAPGDVRHLSTWISHRDMGQLVRCAIEADIHFEIAYGVSNNTRRWWRDESAARLGYRPEDDAERFAATLAGQQAEDPIAARFQGGVFCAWERPDGQPLPPR